jgi:hypothetical protein
MTAIYFAMRAVLRVAVGPRDARARMLAIVLASNFLAFHVEPFEEEYERNHPAPSGSPSVNPIADNWEAFDKTNVPPAATYLPLLPAILFCRIPVEEGRVAQIQRPYFELRDKSPPA